MSCTSKFASLESRSRFKLSPSSLTGFVLLVFNFDLSTKKERKARNETIKGLKERKTNFLPLPQAQGHEF